MAPLSIEMGDFAYAALLSSLPAAAMLLGSAVAMLCVAREAQTVLSVAQHFSAGILIAAISTELVSKMVDSGSGPMGTLAISVGFFGGFALLTAVKACVPEEEGEEEEEKEANSEQADVESAQPPQPRVGSGRSSRLQRASTALSAAQDASSKTSPVPWAFALPVCIDCVMDGFLLGVIAAASRQAGVVMSAATCIEMGFLGVTFGALLRPCGRKRWPLAVLGPGLLLGAGVLTALGAGALPRHGVVLEGLLAFGASSLLFLVTQELLEEAQKNSSGWRSSVWLFVGFFAVVVSERLL